MFLEATLIKCLQINVSILTECFISQLTKRKTIMLLIYDLDSKEHEPKIQKTHCIQKYQKQWKRIYTFTNIVLHIAYNYSFEWMQRVYYSVFNIKAKFGLLYSGLYASQHPKHDALSLSHQHKYSLFHTHTHINTYYAYALSHTHI